MENDMTVEATAESNYAKTVAVFAALTYSEASDNTSVAVQQKPESALGSAVFCAERRRRL
jgi:hypothetical protein